MMYELTEYIIICTKTVFMDHAESSTIVYTICAITQQVCTTPQRFQTIRTAIKTHLR